MFIQRAIFWANIWSFHWCLRILSNCIGHWVIVIQISDFWFWILSIFLLPLKVSQYLDSPRPASLFFPFLCNQYWIKIFFFYLPSTKTKKFQQPFTLLHWGTKSNQDQPQNKFFAKPYLRICLFNFSKRNGFEQLLLSPVNWRPQIFQNLLCSKNIWRQTSWFFLASDSCWLFVPDSFWLLVLGIHLEAGL